MKRFLAFLLVFVMCAALLIACGTTDDPQAPGTSGSNTPADDGKDYLLVPLLIKEADTGLTVKCSVYDKDNKPVLDTSKFSVFVKIVDGKEKTVYNEKVVGTPDESSKMLLFTVDYTSLKSSVNTGKLILTGSDNMLIGDAYNDKVSTSYSYDLKRLPMDLKAEIKLSDNHTASYINTRGEVQSTLSVEQFDIEYHIYSTGITIDFTFTGRKIAGESNYGGFYAVFTANDGTELKRSLCFGEIKADGTFALKTSLSGYASGSGITVSFEDKAD